MPTAVSSRSAYRHVVHVFSEPRQAGLRVHSVSRADLTARTCLVTVSGSRRWSASGRCPARQRWASRPSRSGRAPRPTRTACAVNC